MARNIRIELDHAALEAIEDSYSGRALELAEGIKRRADEMRGVGVAEFEAGLRETHRGSRRYAVVAANEPSNAADNARKNILAKAVG